jgi:hypothetical protein
MESFASWGVFVLGIVFKGTGPMPTKASCTELRH